MRNDPTRRGWQDYATDDRERFKQFMLAEHTGAQFPVNERDMIDALHIEGRTLRKMAESIELAGELAFGGGDEGIFVAEYQEDVAGKNERDTGQAMSLLKRVAARTIFVARLPRRQPGLFS